MATTCIRHMGPQVQAISPVTAIKIITSIAVLSSISAPVLSQDGTLGSRGCGAGCRIDITPLSNVIDMGNGWRKVLVVESTYTLDLETGTWQNVSKYYRGGPRRSQFWLFAHCAGDSLARGFRSDGADSISESIYTEDGTRKDITNTGNVFNQWEALCSAPH